MSVQNINHVVFLIEFMESSVKTWKFYLYLFVLPFFFLSIIVKNRIIQ
jgi:hypothetical protein